MPRAIIHEKFSENTNCLYKCSCGKVISQSMDKTSGKPQTVIVNHGCDKCQEKWLKERIDKAKQIALWNDIKKFSDNL